MRTGFMMKKDLIRIHSVLKQVGEVLGIEVRDINGDKKELEREVLRVAKEINKRFGFNNH